MKKERLKKLTAGIIIIPATILLLFGETYGARPVTSYRQLNRPAASLSTLRPNTPLGEAIDILRNSTKPPLNIVVLWKDLSDNAGIDRSTPIGMDGVSGIPLRKHLELLLMSVSAHTSAELGYVVDRGVIIVATRDSLPRKMIIRLYNITDLASAPAAYFYPGGFGQPYIGLYGGPYGRPYGFGRAYGVRGPRGRARELVGMIETLYGPRRGTRRSR